MVSHRAPALGFTRRDILAAFLGIPAAMAGCTSRAPRQLPAGDIVGASVGVGHQIRDGIKSSPAENAWERTGVVIVGGGIAGLATAWRFLRAGFNNFLLLELEKTPGGNSRSGTCDLGGFPWGAHYVPAPLPENRLLVALLDEMGVLEGHDRDNKPVVAEQFLCRDPQERVFYKGRWYEGLYLHAGASELDLAQFKAFNAQIDRWIGWRDTRGRRAFVIPVASCSDDAEVTALDKFSMAEWLDKHGWTSPRLRWLVNYGCRDDYGCQIEDTSAWAGIFYFASRVSHPGAEAQPFVTWPEGNGRLANHLYSKSQSHARLGMAVADIIPVDPAGRHAVDVVALDYQAQQLRGFHADQVVFAAPHFLARTMLRPYRQDPPRYLSEFEYGSWMVANLFLRDQPESIGFPLAWDNVLYESPSLGYVVATHQKGLDRGPTIFTYYYPLCDSSPREARAKLLGMDWGTCADVALTDLGRAHPQLPDLVERLDVMRWGHAMIRPRPGFIWGQARRAAAAAYRGIYFAHSDLSGVSLFEEAFYHGVRAAEEVLRARGLPVSTIL